MAYKLTQQTIDKAQTFLNLLVQAEMMNLSEIFIPATLPSALGYQLNEALAAAQKLEDPKFIHLRGAWRIKYEAKGIKCVRRANIAEVVATVPFYLTDILDVINIVIHHDFTSGIGLHFPDVGQSEEFENALEDYDYQWDDGLKVLGRKK